jgi:hypothetical protein
MNSLGACQKPVMVSYGHVDGSLDSIKVMEFLFNDAYVAVGLDSDLGIGCR